MDSAAKEHSLLLSKKVEESCLAQADQNWEETEINYCAFIGNNWVNPPESGSIEQSSAPITIRGYDFIVTLSSINDIVKGNELHADQTTVGAMISFEEEVEVHGSERGQRGGHIFFEKSYNESGEMIAPWIDES
eukprot:scaffold584388_cov51-Attheya_sp.AAC.1